MPRLYPHSHLCHGQIIGYTVKLFESTYCVFFRTPEGRRVRRDTNQIRLAAAVEAARTIIEEEYAPKIVQAETTTWEQAIDRLTARLGTSGNRASTLGYYLKLIRSVRATCKTDGPAEVTARMATNWRDQMMSTPKLAKQSGKKVLKSRKTKSPASPKMRSAHYVAGMVNGLSALWQKWFIEDLKIVPSNPWQDVEAPKADKLPVKYATDDMIEHFYGWITARFGDWPFPKLFLATKAYTGCRLMDLCSLKAGQVRNKRLVFPADLTKGRKERAVPVPPELFASLDEFKGKTWLWENYLPGLQAAIKAKGWPGHQLNMEFAPKRLYFWIETLFSEYRKAHKELPTLTTHMFRKRAFTMAWRAGVDARRASIAYGCNVDTLLKHYVLMDEQQVTDDVFAQMGKKQS
jgi:integrase